MKKSANIWLIIATFLVLIGCILFARVMTKLNWDFSKLNTVKYESNIYELSEEFSNISINTDTANINFSFSEDDKYRVECYEEENAKHAVSAEDGTLSINLVNERSVSDYIGNIGINPGSPTITVYLPKGEYTSLFIRESTGDIKISQDFNFENVDISLSTGDVDFFASVTEAVIIKTTTGDICVENISAGTLDLSVSTGRIAVSGVTCSGDINIKVSTGKASITDTQCQNIISKGTTGDFILSNVIASGSFSIERSTGDIQFIDCDAAEIFAKTSTGDVSGSLLTDKTFIAHTNTGSIDIPQTTSGGKCEITTDTGDIQIVIE